MDIKKLLLAVGATALLSGCAATPEDENIEKKETVDTSIDDLNENEILTTENPLSLATLSDVIFELVEVDGAIMPPNSQPVTISFSYTSHFGDIVRGNAGCNNYFTTYSTQRSVLLTGEIVSTDNQCPASQMQIEGFFFKIYSQKPIISFQNDVLTMKTPSNVLTFKKEGHDKISEPKGENVSE